jgi:MFS family permease
MGIGVGLVFVPTATIVTRHFTRNRGLAIGIAMSGGPFGGMILTASTFPFLPPDLELTDSPSQVLR